MNTFVPSKRHAPAAGADEPTWRDLLHRAIDARAHVALAEIAEISGTANAKVAHRQAARLIAEDMARQSPTFPVMFQGCRILSEAWQQSRDWIDVYQWEPAPGSAKAIVRSRVLALIAEGQWDALQLPSPQAALATLLSGECLSANGHTAEYDKQGDITWITNPYGVDGVMCATPDIVAVTRFMTNMATHTDYGPVL